MVMPALLLQKPYKKSKARDHSIHLERRIIMWSKREINALVLEDCAIQQQFIQAVRSNETNSTVPLYIGRQTIFSLKSTTQGDPLAIAMYALAIIPLNRHLHKEQSVQQVWYADEASMEAQLEQLRA